MTIEEILQKRIDYYADKIVDYSSKEDKAFWIRKDECEKILKILNQQMQDSIPDEIPPKEDKSYLPDIKTQPRGSELPLYKRMQFRVVELDLARKKIKRHHPNMENLKLTWKIDKLLELYEEIISYNNQEIDNAIKKYKALSKQTPKSPQYRMANIVIKMYLEELEDLV